MKAQYLKSGFIGGCLLVAARRSKVETKLRRLKTEWGQRQRRPSSGRYTSAIVTRCWRPMRRTAVDAQVDVTQISQETLLIAHDTHQHFHGRLSSNIRVIVCYQRGVHQVSPKRLLNRHRWDVRRREPFHPGWIRSPSAR